MHQAQRAAETAQGKFELEPLQVAVQQRLDVSVRAGGDEALIFPELGDDVRREGDGELGKLLGCDLSDDPLMVRVAVGIQEAARNRLHARVQEGASLSARPRGRSPDDIAVAVDTFGDLEAPVAGNERFRERQEQVVDVVALLGSHLQDVAEARCRDQPQLRALAFDDRVRHERRAMHDLTDVDEGDSCHFDELAEADQGGLGRIEVVSRLCSRTVPSTSS